jgi:hypothetical protein
MRINTNQPLGMGQLAQLYSNGTPNLSQQSQGWVDQQAGNLIGPGGAGNYFAGLRQDANNQVASQQMQQQRMYELAGRQNPVSPFAQQLAIADQAGQIRLQDAQQFAAAQHQQRLLNNPLPADGSAPHLSALQTQEAARLGMGARGYIANQRLGSNASGVAPFGRLSTAGISPEDLYAHPSFQNALQQDPNKAGQVFEALTGTSFHDQKTADGVMPGWHSSYIKQQIAQQNNSVDMLKTGLKNRDLQYGPNGELMQQSWVKSSDPMRPGMVRSGSFEPLSDANKFLYPTATQRKVMGTDFQQYQSLAAERESDRLTAANMQSFAQEQSTSATPGVFRTSAFARLQKKDPAKAASLYRQQMGQASNVLGGADPNAPFDPFDRSY